MASTLCSPCHHRSCYSRQRGRRRSGGSLGPSSAASGTADRPSGLNITRIFCFHPKSITRGSPVSYSSMDVPQNKQGPDHLLILVHGIMASPSDWTYGEAVLKRRLGDNFFIYDADALGQRKKSWRSASLISSDRLRPIAGEEDDAAPRFPRRDDQHHNYSDASTVSTRTGTGSPSAASSSNIYTKTFDGIDVAGRRLANEVLDVILKIAGLRKISFLAHSLGGLFARYAISILYSMETKGAGQCGACIAPTTGGSQKSECTSGLGAIAGLEPISFITLATPHLGVRGKNQLPFLQGLSILEKLAAPLAPLVVGRTGAQLFLIDGEPSKAPLLLQMSSDHEDTNFISALVAFKNRILYKNVSYDHMVGWRTSSIRREKDLSKPLHRSLENYKHIVNVEYCSPVSSDGPRFRLQAAGAKEAAQSRPNRENTEKYHQMMQEEMIHGLQRVGWKKVDVNFHTALWPYSAHNNIHVKNEWLHNAGAGVIAHVGDSIKQQESRKIFPANL